MNQKIKLNQFERKVLAVLVEVGSDEDCSYLTFEGIQQRSCKLDRRRIRLSCRSLARKGFAKYGRGLWTEDGEPFGSGYAATDAGHRFVSPT